MGILAIHFGQILTLLLLTLAILEVQESYPNPLHKSKHFYFFS